MRPHLQLVDPSRVTGRDIGRLVAPGMSTHQLRKEAAAVDVEAWLGPADVPGYPAAHTHAQGEKRAGCGHDVCSSSRLADENPAGWPPVLPSSRPARLREFAFTYWYEIGAAALVFGAVFLLLAGLGGRR